MCPALFISTSMKPSIRSSTKALGKKPVVLPELLHRLRLAAARLALREAGAFLSASAPKVVLLGEKLHALSQHPRLAAPPPFTDHR